ncbi:MAG: hypothetical protein MJZ37_04410 [Bacilli bacterium]|nr:hypothetical protein [Bacilli bacterium]
MGNFEKSVNKLIKIISSISVLGFSIVSLTAAALAWMASNKRVSGDGQIISAYSFDIHCDYDLYQYDPDTFQGTDRDSEGNKFSIESGDFTFLTYDSIFEARNKYTPCLLRISVTGEATNLTEGGTIDVTVRRNTSIAITETIGEGDDEKTVLNPTFTSAMSFKSYIGNTNITYANASDPNEVLTAASTYFKNDGDPTGYVFASKDGEDNWVKSDEYTFNSDFTASDLTSEGVLYIYIYVDYNLDLLDEFVHMDLSAGGDESGDIFSKETLIELKNDLSKIEIRYTKGS